MTEEEKLIEAMAKALAPKAWGPLTEGSYLAQDNRRKASLKHARAALAAAREAGYAVVPAEPTEAMVQTGLDELRTHLGHGGVIVRDAVFCYRAMIEAAR